MLRHQIVFALFVLLAAPLAWADGSDENGVLKGRGLKLLWKDHHLTGTIGSSRVTAKPLSGEFGVKLTHRTYGQTFTSVFKQEGQHMAGAVISRTTKGEQAKVDFVVSKVEPGKGLVQGTLNGRAFTLQVSADSMNGHHFVEPRFQARLGNRTYTFVMEGGQACMGCVVRMGYTILSLVSLNGLW